MSAALVIERVVHEAHSPPDFRERVAALVGGTTFREPLGGGGSRWDHMPAAHLVAAALGMARQAPDDIAPDIATAIALGSNHRRAVIIGKLAGALKSNHHRSARRLRKWMGLVANAAFDNLVHGVRRAPPASVDPEDWATMVAVGCRAMEALADSALWEAEQKWRGEG